MTFSNNVIEDDEKKLANYAETHPHSTYNTIDWMSTLVPMDFPPLDGNDIKKRASYIILLGDSSLDNFYWLNDKCNGNITALLTNHYSNMKQNVCIMNLAVDESQTRHINYGIAPSMIFVNKRRNLNMIPYPIIDEDDDRVYSLQTLQDLCHTQQIRTYSSHLLPEQWYMQPTVILSIGNSDLKMLSTSLNSMEYDINDSSSSTMHEKQIKIKSSVSQFTKLLKSILNTICNELQLNVILVSVFEPFCDCYNIYNVSRDDFIHILQYWMNSFFEIAQKYRLPIIDLTRSLNTYERKHYSKDNIFECSDKSSVILTQLIVKVMNEYVWDGKDINENEMKDDGNINHNNMDNRSMVYFGSDEHTFQVKVNDQNMRDGYSYDLKNQNAFKNKNKIGIEEVSVVESIAEESKSNVNTNENTNKSKGKTTKKMVSYLILMGDSILDNFYWLKDPLKDVRQQLLDMYNDESNDNNNDNSHSVKVFNLAVDESTSNDVLLGIRPSPIYANARKEYNMESYPININDGSKVKPLKILQEMVRTQVLPTYSCTSAVKYHSPTVILSIGGNDIRGLLWNFDMNVLTQGLMTLQSNFQAIIEYLSLEMSLNVIPIICYEPYHQFTSDMGISREQLLNVINIAVCQLLSIAEMYSLPIIDLSRTFNPFIRGHYGSTFIEPSNVSGQFICDLIQFAMEEFNFYDSNSRVSVIYYGLKDSEDGIITQKNTEKARSNYLTSLKQRQKSKKQK